MARKQSVGSYLLGRETTQRQELEWGYVLREAPGPTYVHQSIVTHLTVLLDRHVRPLGLGRVIVSPIDVVLDEPRALVVQPDIVFIAEERRAIVHDRVWGPPDLAIEVLSKGTFQRDRTKKLAWYRQYGVREYWIVNPDARTVEVYAFQEPRASRRVCRTGGSVRSTVLPNLSLPVDEVFED